MSVMEVTSRQGLGGIKLWLSKAGGACGSPWALLGAFVLGVGLRAWWIMGNRDAFPPISDELNYYLGAVNILGGHGYSILGQPITHWPIGYSSFLAMVYAVTGPSVLSTYIVNALLTLLNAGLIWIVVRRWFASTWSANVLASLCLLNPDQILQSAFFRSESLHQTLFWALLVVLSVRKNHPLVMPLAGGVCTGLLIHVRPEYIIVPALFLWATNLVERRRLLVTVPMIRTMALLYAVVALMALPAILRLKAVTGRFYFMSTAGELALFHGNNPESNGGAAAMETVNQITGPNRTPGQYALHYIAQHPFHFLALMPLKFWETYGVRMHRGSPFDVMTINKLPEHLVSQDIGRIGENIRSAADRKRFESSYLFDSQKNIYVLRQGLSDIDKSMLLNTILTTYKYDFETPRGWILLRYAYRAYRLIQFVAIFGCLLMLLAQKEWRHKLFELHYPLVMLCVIAGISFVYMVLAGNLYYGLALLPILWLYPVLLLGLCGGRDLRRR